MPYYCYQCERTIEAEADQSLRCPRCHGEFIEEVNVSRDLFSIDEDSGPADNVEIGDVLQFILTGMDQTQRAASSVNPSPTSSSSAATGSNNRINFSSGGGLIGNLLSSIVQPSSTPSPNSDTSTSQSGPTNNRMVDFMGQLLANLSANAGPGATFHVHIGSATPVHGNINNYVFGDSAFDQIISHLLNHAELHQQGLSDEELKNLPKVPITQQQVDTGTQCTTCMENFSLDEEVIKLPCNHVFHEDCIFPWLKKQRTCPICRSEIPQLKSRPRRITDVDDLD